MDSHKLPTDAFAPALDAAGEQSSITIAIHGDDSESNLFVDFFYRGTGC